MKVLITSDFYGEYELWEAESLEDAKRYTAAMVKGLEAPEPGELIGTQDDILAADAIKAANEIIFIEDYMED